jgi:hypothetical protein
MSDDNHTILLTRIAEGLTRIAEGVEYLVAFVKQSAVTVVVDERRRTQRKSKVEASSTATTVDEVLTTGDLPAAAVDINDDAAMRAHALERIRQLVAQAFEAGCPIQDIEEVIADNAGSTEPASPDLATLSQIIVGLTRLIKSHGAPAEESDADKRIRADILGQLRTLTVRAAATDKGVAAVTAIMRDHVDDGDSGDVDHLDLGKLQVLLAAMQTTVSDAAPTA